MNVAKLQAFCRQFPGAVETLYGEPYNFLVYTVGGRKFAYFKTSEPERWRFSTRVTPDRFIELTDVAGVKPARYRGRYRWITIVNVSGFPAPYLKELVAWSYDRELASLSKAARASVTEIRLRIRRSAGSHPDPVLSPPPKPALECPVCGAPNECAPARTGTFDTPCWCTSVTVDPGVIAALPQRLRAKACLCPRCAAAVAQR